MPSRVRLLDALRAGPQPLDVRELAAVSALHISTVRHHLAVLLDAGLIRRTTGPSAGRGRPPVLYTHTHAAGDPPRGYALLAAVLAGNWAPTAAERARLAEQAGFAMAAGHPIATHSAHGTPPSVAESLAQVGALFTELGFEPEIDPAGPRIRLHACPFRDVAAEHPEVVCSLHLGLLRGVLAGTAAPLDATGLRPLAEPSTCIADLREIPPDTDPDG